MELSLNGILHSRLSLWEIKIVLALVIFIVGRWLARSFAVAMLKDPALTLQSHEPDESSVGLAVRPWGKSAEDRTAFADLKQAIKTAFDQRGNRIPYSRVMRL